jgi:hypothetical protein
VKRLQELTGTEPPPLTSSARRGPASQQSQRLRERFLRGQIVDFRRWTERLGWNNQQTADLLHLCPRTLRQWDHDFSRLTPNLPAVHFQPLGRPCLRSSPQQRNQVIALLDDFGPALGVPCLRQAFPDMARAELQDILLRYRRVWRKLHYQPLRILHWQVPGSVWAADFAQAPQPIDGRYPYLLAVRDLASGRQLLWLPVMLANSDAILRALASLFALYGAPLILKTDNGSPFAAAFLSLVSHPSPLFLFSPPYTPAYNGSIEAGIGSLKTRTETHASRHGRPGFWTFDDAAAAQAEANATARPQGPSGPTPDELWQTRPTIAAAQRALFHATVDRHRALLRTQPDGHDWPEVGPMTQSQERALDRQAIRRALEELGYLLYSRRRIPLAIKTKKVANVR